MKKVEVYNTFSSVGSDHRIVSMRFQLKLRANCSKKANPEKCDWYAFRMNNELQKQYTVDVKNRYEALLHSELLDSPTDKYGLFVS